MKTAMLQKFKKSGKIEKPEQQKKIISLKGILSGVKISEKEIKNSRNALFGKAAA